MAAHPTTEHPLVVACQVEGDSMERHSILTSLTVLAILFLLRLLAPGHVFAHCDGMDGPVVKASQRALETENVNLVLIWVQKQDEAEIKEVFQKTLAVRKLSPAAKELAERYFFETLVRLHRAGEGAPYTGLKPAGRDLGPAIPAADKAIADGAAESLLHLLTVAVQDGVREQFKHVTAKKPFDKADVEAGRAYVNTYVAFMHYVERLYAVAKNPAHGHFPEAATGGAHQ
jgi:hypothetical protein